MFYILSQNGEKLYNMNGHIEAIGYEEGQDYGRRRGKEETIRHTIQVYDGCMEEVAEYQTKEDCLKVINLIALAVENTEKGNIMIKLPTKEELTGIMKTIEQFKREKLRTQQEEQAK